MVHALACLKLSSWVQLTLQLGVLSKQEYPVGQRLSIVLGPGLLSLEL